MSDHLDPSEVRVPEDGSEPSVGRRLFDEITGVNVDWRSALLVPALAILTALIISGFIIIITDIDLLRLYRSDFGAALGDSWDTLRGAYAALWQGSFGGLRAVSETLTASAPLILAGLAVGIGFRAGLFNIGAEGQMLIGGMTAVMVGFSFTWMPIFIHLPLALLAGMVGGRSGAASPDGCGPRPGRMR